jgi:hypothetical protein
MENLETWAFRIQASWEQSGGLEDGREKGKGRVHQPLSWRTSGCI